MAKPKPLTPEQFPYTGPYGLAGSGLKAKGPTAEALKRACARMGVMPWREFDQHYNKRLEDALDELDPGGQNGYAEGRWKKVRGWVVPKGLDHEGELALDFYAIKLVQDEAGSHGTTDEEVVRGFITEWWEKAAAVQARWIYDDSYRPVPLDAVHVAPEHGGRSDCSSTVIICRRNAMIRSKLQLVDPSKQRWTGFGNTDFYLEDWPKVAGPFQVGDLAHFSGPRHVIECIEAGDYLTARWGSNGRSAGPELLKLPTYSRFPHDFMFVVRPELLA